MITLCLIFALISRADDDFSKTEYRATPLGAGLFLLEGAGGNITAATGPDGTFLVDDDFAPMADKLVAKLRELGGDSPRWIVNTHFHYDHSGGNEVFGRTALIFGAGETRARLGAEQVLWKEKHPALPPHARPALTFEGELRLHRNGEEIRLRHLPRGHTDGDVVAIFEHARVASLGDLYFAGMHPIFHPEHDGSLAGYLANLEAVYRELPADVKIVPGHGPLSTKAELRRYLDMIHASIRVVKKGIRRGLSLEAIQREGLPAEWERFGHGDVSTPRWLAAVYAAVRK